MKVLLFLATMLFVLSGAVSAQSEPTSTYFIRYPVTFADRSVGCVYTIDGEGWESARVWKNESEYADILLNAPGTSCEAETATPYTNEELFTAATMEVVNPAEGDWYLSPYAPDFEETTTALYMTVVLPWKGQRYDLLVDWKLADSVDAKNTTDRCIRSTDDEWVRCTFVMDQLEGEHTFAIVPIDRGVAQNYYWTTLVIE